jgi:protein AIR1/2
MLEGKRKAEGWAREAIGGDEYEEWCYNCAKVRPLHVKSSVC